jgi:transcriptional regulator with XRE-family HTH domain
MVNSMAPLSRLASPTNAVGERVRNLRRERQLTQTELARQIGIQQSDLSRMEKGEYRVSLDVLFKLLRTFDLSLGEFFGDASARELTAVESGLLQSYRILSREAQQEVIDFVDFKRSREKGSQ